MKKILFVLLAALVFMFNGCGVFSSTSYSSPEVLLTNGFRGDSIAVFDINTEGSGLSSSTGKFVSDNLAETLFLKAKVKIIDRTETAKALLKLSINTQAFDKDELKKFGVETRAKYVVVGQLYKNTTSDFWDKNKEKNINLGLRIISTETCDVVGAASISAEYKNNLNKVLTKMIDKIVNKINDITV